MQRERLNDEQVDELHEMVTKLFKEGLTDRVIGETILESKRIPGKFDPVRICLIRKKLGLVKDGRRGARLGAKNSAGLKEDLREMKQRREIPEDPEQPLPQVDTRNRTFADLVRKIEELAVFAKEVQYEFKKKGGSIFF